MHSGRGLTGHGRSGHAADRSQSNRVDVRPLTTNRSRTRSELVSLIGGRRGPRRQTVRGLVAPCAWLGRPRPSGRRACLRDRSRGSDCGNLGPPPPFKLESTHLTAFRACYGPSPADDAGCRVAVRLHKEWLPFADALDPYAWRSEVRIACNQVVQRSPVRRVKHDHCACVVRVGPGHAHDPGGVQIGEQATMCRSCRDPFGCLCEGQINDPHGPTLGRGGTACYIRRYMSSLMAIPAFARLPATTLGELGRLARPVR